MERKQKSLAWYILVYGTGLLYHFYRLESARVPLPSASSRHGKA